jgi:hypothetical protein
MTIALAPQGSVLVKHVPRNRQVKIANALILTPYYNQKKRTVVSFQSEDSSDGSLTIPAGGELWLNIADERDAHNYQILQDMEVAGMLVAQDVTLIDVAQKDADKIRLRQAKREADEAVQNLLDGDIKFVVKLMNRLGLSYYVGMNENTLRNELESFAESEPERLLNTLNDTDLPILLLIDAALDNNIITIEDGSYFYGTKRMGTHELVMVDFIKSNADVHEAIKNEVSRHDIPDEPIRIASAPVAEQDYSIQESLTPDELKKLVATGVVTKSPKGYYFRKLSIGSTASATIAFLDKNPSMLTQLKKAL